MTNPEIEKLADEYARNNPSNYPHGDEYFEPREAFKAGYLKGVEKAIKICKQSEKRFIEYTSEHNIAMASAAKQIGYELEQLLSSEGEK